MTLALPAADMMTMMTTGGCSLIPVGNTVVTLLQVLGAFRILTEAALLNLAIQGNELNMFCFAGKPMGEPTENRLYNSAKDLSEVGAASIIYYGMSNPYAYSKVTTSPLPDETGIVVQGSAGVPMVPDGNLPAVSYPMSNPAVIVPPEQPALPGRSGGVEDGLNADIYSARITNEVLDGDLLKNANAMKDTLPAWAKNKGNFGYSEAYIEGLDNTQFFAHSSIQTKIPSIKDSGISIKPESSPFKAVEVNGNNVINGEGAWLRDVDTEYKILSDIQSKLGDNYSASGKIKLYTELEPCPSCQSIIKQFKEMYPNIDVEVIYSVEK
ncbi:MAG: hypothetical protein HDQ96_05470 [Lachnospiraceae bacterium]|nr:hypothetical protein [Lachnospiraceae bacterium]